MKRSFNSGAAAKPKTALVGLLAAGIAAMALTADAPSAWSQQAPAEPLRVTANKAAVVRLAGRAQNVIIGDPRVVDVTVENRSMLVLFGRTPGETNMIVLDAQNREILSVPVVVTEEKERHVTVTSSAKAGLKEVVYSCSQRCVQLAKQSASEVRASGGGGQGPVPEAAPSQPEPAAAPAPAAQPQTQTPEQAPDQGPRRRGYTR